jgi:hypothetical protein
MLNKILAAFAFLAVAFSAQATDQKPTEPAKTEEVKKKAEDHNKDGKDAPKVEDASHDQKKDECKN